MLSGHNRDSSLQDNVQYEAARVVTGAIRGTNSARLRDKLAWEPLSIRRELLKLSQFYKIVKNLATRYLNELLPKLSSERTHFRLRSREHFTLLLRFKSLFFHQQSMAGILWT